MNLRQKAKRFKRLYEEGLPKKPYPVVYQTNLPKHYRTQVLVDAADLDKMPEVLKAHIENMMMKEIRPLIWNNVIIENDKYTNKYRCSLDIWMKGE